MYSMLMQEYLCDHNISSCILQLLFFPMKIEGNRVLDVLSQLGFGHSHNVEPTYMTSITSEILAL